MFLFILFLLTFVFVTVQAPSLPVEIASPGRAALCPRSIPGYTEDPVRGVINTPVLRLRTLQP
ncbi:hypothetical protein BLA28_05170 [Eisenbergiella tayi]|nr:hypothetical protein BLA28_05170 [Eisenbergiella tayi]